MNTSERNLNNTVTFIKSCTVWFIVLYNKVDSLSQFFFSLIIVGLSIYNIFGSYLPWKFIIEWWDEEMEGPANDDIIVEGYKEGHKHCTEAQTWKN